MWKRLNRSKQPQINEPFRSIVNAGSDPYSSVISDKQLPLTHDHTTPRELPCSPYDSFRKSGSTYSTLGHRDSRISPTTASSSFSIPPSPTTKVQSPRKSISYKDGDVSPPSSPDIGMLQTRKSGFYHYDEEVSPIEDTLPTASSQLKGHSQEMELLPASPRKKDASREGSSEITAANIKSKREAVSGPNRRQAIDPRWDPYSGEITSSEKGKPQSVKPRLFGNALRSANDKPDSKNNAAVPTTLSERIRKLTSHTTSVKQEKTNSIHTSKKQLAINTKSADSSSRFLVKRSHEVTPPAPAPTLSSAPAPVPTFLPSPSISSVDTTPNDDIAGKSSPVLDQIEPTESITSMLERHSDIGSPLLSKKKLANLSQPKTPALAPTPAAGDKVLSLKNNRKSSLPDESRFSPTIDPFKEVIPLDTEITTLHTKIPNNSSVISMPNITNLSVHEGKNDHSVKNVIPLEDQQLIYNTQQQHQQALNLGLDRVVRKPTLSESETFARSVSDSSEQISSAIIRAQTLNKNYPNDRIISLQAKLDDLAYRRNKIARNICQLKEIMPRDTLFISDELQLRRKDEKKQIEMLLSEEADIKREEHEASLQLHRAWKRKDYNSNFEPTCLWVRRVTT